MLLLSPPTLRLVAPPGEAHDHGHDDGDLNSSDDGSDEDIVQLLSAGHHVQDVKVQQLITLRPTIRCLTPAGGQVVSHLTVTMFTELGIVIRTGGGAIVKLLPFTRFGWCVDLWFGFDAVVFPVFIMAASHVLDVDLELLEAGRLPDVAGGVVGDAVAAAYRVIVVAVTHDVTHAQQILRVFVTLGSKLAVSTFGGLFPAPGAFIISISRS